MDADTLAALAVVLARQWNYPPAYARLVHEALKLGLSELSDPAKLAEALRHARGLGLLGPDGPSPERN